MRSITIFFFATFIFYACTRSANENGSGNNAWLEQQKKELAPCVCLMAIFQGTYQGNTIYVVRSIDPGCCGVDLVYKSDGTTLFELADLQAQQNFSNAVTDLHKIWSCSKGEK